MKTVLLKNFETGLFYSKEQNGFNSAAGEATRLDATQAAFVKMQFADAGTGSLPHVMAVPVADRKGASTAAKLASIIATADKVRKLVEKHELDGDPIVDEAVAEIDNDLNDVLMLLQDL